MRSFTLLSTAMLLAASPVLAAEKPLTKADVEKIIDAHLNEHPEIILQAVQKFQQRQVEEQQKQAANALQSVKKDVYNNPDTPVYGPKDGIKVVEFYDYNCPACKMMFNTLQAYLKDHKDIQILFKEYPIFGAQSEYPARVAHSVYRIAPDKYFKFHSALMSHQGHVDEAAVDEALKSLGLDVEKVKKDAASQSVQDMISDTKELANKLGATGTPMVIIGDEVVPHALDLQELIERVEKAKKAKK